MAQTKGIKVLADNRKAYHNYTMLEKFEAGIELFGTEVKSLRQGNFNMGDSYAQVKNGELWLLNMHVSPYEEGNRFNKDPIRDRKLLMHKREIMRLFGQVKQEGLTLVPTKVYLKNGRVKVEIALAKGKKDYDKRRTIMQRDTEKEMRRAVKHSRRYSED